MAELSTFLGTKVGTIKLGDKEYNVYRLNLNDLAELELKYGWDEFSGGSKRLNMMLDVLTLSIRREDKTVTREMIGNLIDPLNPEQMAEIGELYVKIMGGETPSLAGGKSGGKSRT